MPTKLEYFVYIKKNIFKLQLSSINYLNATLKRGRITLFQKIYFLILN